MAPRRSNIKTELAGAIRRGKAAGRLGPEHLLDIARAWALAELLMDEATPPSTVASLDRRFDVVLMRLGLVGAAAGETDLDKWLAGVEAEAAIDDELDPEIEAEVDQMDTTRPEALDEWLAAVDADVEARTPEWDAEEAEAEAERAGARRA